jgi:murein DD-endopeptidase MepM/ murein hydrolase activator NlpD
VVYTFEPYSKDVADAERQLTLINVKVGDTITAGQSLGKLIKTAPQSHVHIHIMKDNKEFCFVLICLLIKIIRNARSGYNSTKYKTPSLL